MGPSVDCEIRTSGRTQKEYQETGKGGWECRRTGRMQSGEEFILIKTNVSWVGVLMLGED